MTLPRRGPLTPEERLANAVRSQPVNTADGGIITRKANRRTPTAPLPDIGTGGSNMPRIALVTGFSSTDYASMSQPDGKYYLYDLPSGADWGFDEDKSGGAIGTNGGDGGIYFFEEGIYAVTLILNVDGIQDADPGCTVRLFADTSSPFGTGFSCIARGGDARVSHSDLTSTCRVYYDAGQGLDDGLFPGFMYTNLDMAVVTSVGGLIQVQKIV